jgi:phosphoglycolate phosphatase
VTFTVGFDLDMTLIDPRPGMVALFDAMAAETGLPLDGRSFVSRLGPPLRNEFARYGLDRANTDRLVARFRELYPAIVIPATTAMPGAASALRSVTERGGRVIVVTAKLGQHAARHLEMLELPATAVIGELWSAGKATALAEYGAEIYVGDHLGDITGARAADALAVGVATGPIAAEDLAAAGADVVLQDLTQFPDWLDTYLLATVH